MSFASGCAALHPLKGVPVRYLPEEHMGFTRAGQETIDLAQLRQPEPVEYLIDGGDVLGIYVENIFPKNGEVPPVYYPVNNDAPPTMGYPVPVREDGTISLPYVGRISVRGRSVAAIEDLLRKSYMVNQKILQNDRLNITVSLQKRRTYQVVVIRQESVAPMTMAQSGMGGINLGEVKRGMGQIVNLPAYRNDVLRALAQTGGLPGLDAENAIYVLRGVGRRGDRAYQARTTKPRSFQIRNTSTEPPHHMAARISTQSEYPIIRGQSPEGGSNRYGFSPAGVPPAFTSEPLPNYREGMNYREGFNANSSEGNFPNRSGFSPDPNRFIPEDGSRLDWDVLRDPPDTAQELLETMGDGTDVIRIPVRLFPDEELEFGPEDIILHDGDIVFIESRDTEIFYTGGLLGGGQYTLPRDYDLDVLGALSIANGRQQSNTNGSGFGNRIGGISAMNQDISVSASIVVVLRKLPDGGQIPIKINIYKAMRDPNERVLIQPGDLIVLQYTPIEAVAAFIERNLLAGSLIGIATAQSRGNGN